MVPNGQAFFPAQNPISLGWVVMRYCEAFRGPPLGGRGAARAQRYKRSQHTPIVRGQSSHTVGIQ